jgi:hypothetical protein
VRATSPYDADYEEVPSRSNLTSPILRRSGIEARREGCHLRPADGQHLREPRAFLDPPNYCLVRACAVKPCAFGAPLTRLWGLTTRPRPNKQAPVP